MALVPLPWVAVAAPPDDPRVVWEIAYGPNAWQPTPDQVHVSWLFSLAHGQLVHGVTPEQMGFSFDGETWNLFVEGIVEFALIADRDLTHPRILDMPGHVFCNRPHCRRACVRACVCVEQSPTVGAGHGHVALKCCVRSGRRIMNEVPRGSQLYFLYLARLDFGS